MKTVWKRLICIAVPLLLLGALACGQKPVEPETEAPKTPMVSAAPTQMPAEEAVEVVVQANTPVPTAPTLPPETHAPAETAVPSEAPSPVPSPATVTIGAVGDIMITSQIVEDAKVSGGAYDFTTLFAPFEPLFNAVDWMCGNLETPLAGQEAGFAQRKDKADAYVFNAPDSVLDALRDYGVDLLSTANNHALDMGADGLYRTVETIREKGFYQTGTFLNEQDRDTPCIVEINGIRIGFVASTKKINGGSAGRMREDERQTAIAQLQKGDRLTDDVLRDIARVKNAGAEFVILFAHWDFENDNPTAEETKRFAKQLIAAGADCIVGSHPHRIKGAEYVTVQRENGPYTGLVLYSLGNFTANNTFEKMVGLYAQLTLCKDFTTGGVSLTDAAVLPTFTMRRAGSGAKFTVVPAYADPSAITGLKSPLTDAERQSIAKARAHAFGRLGTVEGLRILDAPAE